MAKLRNIGGKKLLELSDQEAQHLNLAPEEELEIAKAKKGVWVLLSSKPKTSLQIPSEEANIIALLMGKSLSDRVEGKFETFLNKQQKELLQKMVKAGKVELFKLSEKYKKPVYKLKETKEEKVSKEKGEIKIKEPELAQNGFLIIGNEERAKRLSNEYEELIKEKQLKGLKAFDGKFYLILGDVYEKGLKKIEDSMKEGDITLDELSARSGLNKDLTKVICEFMKEDGDLMERKRELYAYVG